MTVDLLFFPDYRQANPYQDLLYRHAARGFTVAPGGIAKARDALRLGGSRPVIFHLHWEDAVYRNEADEPAAGQAARSFLDDLEAFLDEGGRLVWSLHNAGPHDGRYAAVHRALVAELASLADLVHVHGPAAAVFARTVLRVPPERVAIVAHGNFLPIHRPLERDVAGSKAALGLPPAGRTVLLFGRLGAYKGGAELLRAFAAHAGSGHLLIAGKQVTPLAATIAELPATMRGRVHVRDGFLPEHELPRLFHAADVVAAPYRAVLTSGAVLLALSLRRPVIAPRLPSLVEILTDGQDAFLYDPGSPNGLKEALERAAALSDVALDAMQEAAGRTAERYDWASSGVLMEGLYHKLRALRRPFRCGVDHGPSSRSREAAGHDGAASSRETGLVQP